MYHLDCIIWLYFLACIIWWSFYLIYIVSSLVDKMVLVQTFILELSMNFLFSTALRRPGQSVYQLLPTIFRSGDSDPRRSPASSPYCWEHPWVSAWGKSPPLFPRSPLMQSSSWFRTFFSRFLRFGQRSIKWHLVKRWTNWLPLEISSSEVLWQFSSRKLFSGLKLKVWGVSFCSVIEVEICFNSEKRKDLTGSANSNSLHCLAVQNDNTLTRGLLMIHIATPFSHSQSPIKGINNPYNPHNFDEFYAQEYGGWSEGPKGRFPPMGRGPPPMGPGGPIGRGPMGPGGPLGPPGPPPPFNRRGPPFPSRGGSMHSPNSDYDGMRQGKPFMNGGSPHNGDHNTTTQVKSFIWWVQGD